MHLGLHRPGLVLLVTLGVLLSACAQRPAASSSLPPRPAAAPVVAAQLGKDAAILREADQIDALAPAALPHTTAQRAAIAAAPAQDVARLTASYEASLDAYAAKNTELAGQVTKLTHALAAAKDATDRLIRLGGYALVALLTIGAAVSIPLAQYVPWLGPRISIALGLAALSLFILVQAYEWTKAHPWITGVTGALLLAAGVLAYANRWHAKTSTQPLPA